MHRLTFSAESTQGSLDVDGVFFCYSLEPRRDQSQGKPYCIPCGTYPLVMQWSERFQRITPRLQDVPDFNAVEIHPGNFPSDTEGCLLVGQTRQPDFVGNSDLAFDALLSKILGERLTITYQEETA